MGTLISVYLLLALGLAILCFCSTAYAAMYGKAPFGFKGLAINDGAARLNSMAHETITIAGMQLGSAILVVLFVGYAAFIGLIWPHVVYTVWWKK